MKQRPESAAAGKGCAVWLWDLAQGGGSIEQSAEEVSMRTLVVYESMYGNTHAIAEAIADGIRQGSEVRVVRVAEATNALAQWADLLVVGGPTHAHGMTSAGTRENARIAARKPDASLKLDAAAGPGLRDWLESLDKGTGKQAVAFDTRIKGPAILTGRASSGIAKALREHGYAIKSAPESFLVDMKSKLVGGELERAKAWGSQIAV
jgi:flavodoxin